MKDLLVASSLENLPDFERRSALLEVAKGAPPVSSDAEAWRYSSIDGLDLTGFSAVTFPPADTVDDTFMVGDRAATVHIMNGYVQFVKVDEKWIDSGLAIGPGVADGLSEMAREGEETVLDTLGQAWCPNELVIELADNTVVDQPVVVISHHNGGDQASFPYVRVVAGANSEVSVLELQTSSGAGLVVPTTTISCGEAARVKYMVIQNLDTATTSLGRSDVTVGRDGSVAGGTAAFGGAYARVRNDIDLAGAGSSIDLVAMYYGTGSQTHDFRTFVHHSAPNTTSNMLFKGTVDDEAGNVYTGMVKIHPDGAGSNSDQTNRNIKLSEDAWAWSVPNLEIENSDVKCSHASSVTPVDADQRFYLHSRGVPPQVADRLIIGGFFRSALESLPVEGAAAEIASLLETKLSSGLFASAS